MNDDDPLFLWRLAEEHSVVDAAILIAGGDPSVMDAIPNHFDQWEYEQRTTGHPGFAPAFSALKGAIHKGSLAASLRYKVDGVSHPGFDQDQWFVSGADLAKCLDDDDPFAERPLAGTLKIEREPDWSKSTVDAEDLRAWLKSRGFSNGFFLRDNSASSDDFMDSDHDHFAPELALAVKAWRALSSTQKNRGGVIATIEKWIDDHPEEWGPLNCAGTDPKKRIATVANWNKVGGASRTGD